MLSRNQRPKIDEYPDYLFIVLHFPVFDRQVERLNAGELDIFVGRDFLVTIPNTPLQPVEYLFERCRQKEELRDQLFSRGSGYLLYRIIDDAFDYCFPMLRKIGNKLDALEDEIFEGRSEDIVRDISNAKQEIINFRKVIRPQRPVLRDLEKLEQPFLAREGGELELYFDDIGDSHERIWDMLENYKEVVEALEETNESYISHRVNDILRVLTSISVIVLPLTLIASIWGMNVGVPGEGDRGRLLRHRRRDGRRCCSRWSPTSAAAAGSDRAEEWRGAAGYQSTHTTKRATSDASATRASQQPDPDRGARPRARTLRRCLAAPGRGKVDANDLAKGSVSQRALAEAASTRERSTRTRLAAPRSRALRSARRSSRRRASAAASSSRSISARRT